jgi:hypothetical protein
MNAYDNWRPDTVGVQSNLIDCKADEPSAAHGIFFALHRGREKIRQTFYAGFRLKLHKIREARMR